MIVFAFMLSMIVQHNYIVFGWQLALYCSFFAYIQPSLVEPSIGDL